MNIRKYLIAVLAAASGFAMLVPLGAVADQTNTLQVTASVTGTCQFDVANVGGGNETLDFGALDQLSTSDATAGPVSLDFWCTTGTVVGTFTANNGNNSSGCPGTRCLSNGSGLPGGLIAYTLNFVTPVGTVGQGKTNTISVDFDAVISNADYVDARPGNFTDFVTLNIAP